MTSVIGPKSSSLPCNIQRALDSGIMLVMEQVIVGSVSAGLLMYVDGVPMQPDSISPPKGRTIAAEVGLDCSKLEPWLVKDDSMAGAGIFRDHYVLVDPAKLVDSTPPIRSIAVCVIDTCATIGRYIPPCLHIEGVTETRVVVVPRSAEWIGVVVAAVDLRLVK